MKLNSIEEIKKEYGIVVTNAAAYNLLQTGLQNFEKTYLSEQTRLINKMFRDLEENKEVPFPLTEEFVLRVLNCQHALLDLKKPMEIMTYFSKPTDKEEE